MNINVDEDAARHIREHGGAVVIALNYEPSLGGCACNASRITGSYVPVIAVGRPAPDEARRYQSQQVGQVQVFFPPGMRLKQGRDELHIRLRGLLALHWLELEGAQGISVVSS